MPEYFTLFNAVTDAIAQLEKAVAALKQAQLDAEEAYIRRGEQFSPPLILRTRSRSAHTAPCTARP